MKLRKTGVQGLERGLLKIIKKTVDKISGIG